MLVSPRKDGLTSLFKEDRVFKDTVVGRNMHITAKNANDQVGMNGDTFSIKAPKECSKKFAAFLKREFLTRGNLLRIFLLFLEDFGAPL